MRLKRTRLRIAERIMAHLMGSPATMINNEPFNSDNPDHLREIADASLNGAEALMARSKRAWNSQIWALDLPFGRSRVTIEEYGIEKEGSGLEEKARS